MFAIAALWSSAAMEQCAPDPSVSGQAVSCSGTTSNVYAITTDNSPRTVSAGATVATSTGQGILASMPATGYYSPRYAAITVDSSVAASKVSGILVLSAPPMPAYYDFNRTSATITIAQGASISGLTGIFVRQTANPYSAYGGGTVSIDNEGTTNGTDGAAIYGDNNSHVRVSVTHEATGTIGAINAP